jgi:transcription elongation factor Elf1
MNYIDVKYIDLLSPQLLKFTQKKKETYNFRCPYCGDSERKQNKARGYLFVLRDSFVFKCHNCGISKNFSQFLKDQNTNLHDVYVMDRYKEGMTGKNYQVKEPDFKVINTKPVFKNIFSKPPFVFESLQTIESLDDEHEAKLYLINRRIPEKYFSDFYYVENFNEWEKNKIESKERRIIIPLRKCDGEVFGYQGRSLEKNTNLRYITTILDKKHPKIFGLERINPKETVYVTEGPFDSLFLNNSLAMCGADIVLDKKEFPNRVFIFDNEPRNLEIVNRYEKSLIKGESVVIWPESIKEKDINDMILAGHNVKNVIKLNTYKNLEAKVKLNHWKKV